MTRAMAKAENAAQTTSENADFSQGAKKWRRFHCYWSPDAPPPMPITQRRARPRRYVFLRILHLDEIEKKIWWRCFKRTRPAIARALAEPECLNLIEAFDAAVVVEYDQAN